MAYTFILDRQRNIRAAKEKNRVGRGMGKRSQRLKASMRLRIGAKIKGRRFAGVGVECSFRNSFKASARGCGRPIRITLFGPFRN